MSNVNNPTYNESEYNSLRAEVITRVELRYKIISFALSIAGALMGFGLGTQTLALIFPPISLFLAIMWAQNDIRALQISDYLQTFENNETRLGWITYYKSVQKTGSFKPGWPLSVLAPGGMFIITSLLAIGIGLSKTEWSALDITLLCFDLASVAIMTWFMLFIRRSRINRRTTTI